VSFLKLANFYLFIIIDRETQYYSDSMLC